jgi:hypothetical protein
MTNKTRRTQKLQHHVSGIPETVRFRRSGHIIVPGTAAVNDFISHLPKVNATEWISHSLPAFINFLAMSDPEKGRLQIDHIILQIHNCINSNEHRPGEDKLDGTKKV